MQKLTNKQTVYVALPKKDYVETSTEEVIVEEERNWLEQLIEKIWGMDYDGFDRTVDVHIKRIRENLGHLPGFKVVTVRGLGYKVEVE